MTAARNKHTATTQRTTRTTHRNPLARKTAAERTPTAPMNAPVQERGQVSRRQNRPAMLGETMAADPAQPVRQPGKLAMIEALLRRPVGASIPELRDATTWQAHSIRAALTGLRKVGRAIQRDRDEGGVTRYRIADALAER